MARQSLSTQTINAGGVATYATSTLTAGVHQITAVYNGDAAKQIQGSTSAVLSQDVQAPTTATLTSSLNPSNLRQLRHLHRDRSSRRLFCAYRHGEFS